MKSKLLAGGMTVLALLIVSSSAAFAQDCFIINRSDQASQQVGTHSSVWGSFSIHDLLMAPPNPDDPENSGPGCTLAAADAIVAQLKAAGLPTVIATRTNMVIGGNSSNPNLGNGKGLEHFDESPYFGTVMGIAAAYAEAHPGSCQAAI